MKTRRAYVQTVRAQQAADTEERILDEADRLFATRPFAQVSLAEIAEGAGVTIPTLQRRFGDKHGLVAAWAGRIRERVRRQRGEPPVGDLRACVAQLVDHYEAEGRMMWHLLRQEAEVAFLQEGLGEARAVHRAWVERVFSSSLGCLERGARRRRVDALVAATDLFTWKLLRLDLGRSRADVEQTMLAMAQAVAGGA